MSTYREIKSRINVYLNKTGLIQSNDKILVAVSGGMDSMFLLYMLIDLQKELNLELSICHVNHNIRANSNRDEEFVIEQGKLLDIPIIVERLHFSKKKDSENTEAWARNHRYGKLEEVRDKIKFDKIATGHHINDQIETVLQRISEKSGINGLKGIHKQVENVVRPILPISKKDIESAVKELNIQYINDETNQNIKLKRNYFRHKVIPNWEKLYPNLGESVQSICNVAEKNTTILNYFLKELENNIVITETSSIKRINLEQFEILPLYIKIAFFDYLLIKKSRRKHHWNELERIITSTKIGKIYEIDDFELLKDRKEWIIRPKLKAKQKQITIDVDESIQYNNFMISIKNTDTITINNSSYQEFIDKNKVKNKKLIVRQWQDGDVFKPIGLKGKKKVSDFLIDEKVSKMDKENQLVVLADNEIIWLCGHRLSETVKIDDNTKQYLELSIMSKVG